MRKIRKITQTITNIVNVKKGQDRGLGHTLTPSETRVPLGKPGRGFLTLGAGHEPETVQSCECKSGSLTV